MQKLRAAIVAIDVADDEALRLKPLGLPARTRAIDPDESRETVLINAREVVAFACHLCGLRQFAAEVGPPHPRAQSRVARSIMLTLSFCRS